MICKNCASKRLARISAKCDDRCFVELGGKESADYVPNDMGIGGGDYVKFIYCLDCGNIQGNWPLPTTEIEFIEEE